jgi:hypothetical protein
LVENTIYLEFLRGEKKFIGLQLFDGKRLAKLQAFESVALTMGG